MFKLRRLYWELCKADVHAELIPGLGKVPIRMLYVSPFHAMMAYLADRLSARD